MTSDELKEIYQKFPSVLRDKLFAGEVQLPANTLFEYERILAFRGIVRSKDDYTPLNSADMRSHFERGIIPRASKESSVIAGYYAVSLFEVYTDFKNAFKFPRPNKKVAQGYIHFEGGPCAHSTEDSHVNWWLYSQGADYSTFKIKEDINE